MKSVVVIDDHEIVSQMWPPASIRSGLRTIPAMKLRTKSMKQFPQTMSHRWRQESIRRCKQQFILYCGNPALYAKNVIETIVDAPRVTRNFNGLFVTNPFCGNIHDRTDKANRFMAHCSFGCKDGPCYFKYMPKRDTTTMTTYELLHWMFCSFYNDMLINFKTVTRSLNQCDILKFIYFSLMFICDYFVSNKNVKALDILVNESKLFVYPSFVNKKYFDKIESDKTTFIFCENENEYLQELSIFCAFKFIATQQANNVK